MKLLYRTAEWHALAKLRMHTDTTLALLEALTNEFGQLLRQFRDLTCSKFSTFELPREITARKKREISKQSSGKKLEGCQSSSTRMYIILKSLSSDNTCQSKAENQEQSIFLLLSCISLEIMSCLFVPLELQTLIPLS